MVPTIGRIVHFQTHGTPGGEYLPEPIAAIVTKVHGAAAADDFLVDLFAIYPNGTSHKTDVPFSAEPKPGHWNWPPRAS